MSSATVRTLSAYQIHELREMFFQNTIIEKIGRVDETSALIVEYRGGMNNNDGICKTKSIPHKQPAAYFHNTEEADFEVIQPIQIEK